MKVQELINAYKEEIKKEDCEYPYDIWTAEDILLYIDNDIKQVASGLNLKEHRWYIKSMNVYKCEDGFIGIYGPASLKSECMGYSDTEEDVEIFKCEEIPTVTYKRK